MGKVHSLNSGKVSIQIQLKALPELSECTLPLEQKGVKDVCRLNSTPASTVDTQIESS